MAETRPAKTWSIAKKPLATLMLATTVSSTPAAATHGSLPCQVPQSFEPLFSLLDAFIQIAFLGGVGLATFGLSVAALLIIAPGEEYTRKGKKFAKAVLVGVIILLSANMVVQFIVSQLGTTIC